MQKNNSKLNSKILIISQLRPRSFEPINSHILFLNEGCKLYKINKKYKYELYKNSSVLNYKINSIEKKFSYVLKVYEFLLKKISLRLNKFHNLNYSAEYWRIIIGPWLFEFISIIFENCKKLENINSNYLIKYVEIAKFKQSGIHFKDYNDFAYSIIADEFNNRIYKDLLNYYKNIKIKYFYFNKKNKKIKNRYNSLDFIVRCLKSILLFSNNFLNNKIFFHDTYLNFFLRFLLGIRIGQLNTYYKPPLFKDSFLNKKFRAQKLFYSNDKFLNIFNDLVFKYIPTSYLENFDKYRQNVKTINWPKNPKIIFSSSSFIFDDFFKIWLAEQKENFSSRFMSGQHGGGFFTNKFNFYELHQKKVSDKILTWGYKKENIYKPLFNFKTATKKIKFNKKGTVLMVDYELSRFPGGFTIYNNFSFPLHLNEKLNFIKKLNNNVRNKLVFRPYIHDLGWSTLDRLKDTSKSIKIDRNKNIYDSLNNSRVAVVNLNSTVFLETLNLNFPTIIYFNSQQDLIRKDAKLYFDLLKKVNIYFNDSETAAKHLNNIWNQVDKWWYNEKTQQVISDFCNRFSRRTNRPINELASFFKKNL